MPSEEAIPDIIDALYAGALDPSAWSRGIKGMVDLVSGSAALLFCYNPTTGRVLRDENHNVNPVALAEYSNYWCTKDIRLAPGAQRLVGEPIYDAKILSARVWKTSDIYNELLVPEDAPWVLAFWLHKSSDKVVDISIQGSRRRGPFDEVDGKRLLPLIPHLRRALEIKDRLEGSQVHADTLATSLDTLSYGVAILDERGRVLELNTCANAMFGPDNGIRLNPDGTLLLRDPAGTELYRWIAARAPPTYIVDGLLHVPRPRARPISVMVTPLPALATSWISGDPRWLLLLFDPEQRMHASNELLARDLGISDREAEIAALLVAGYHLSRIAAQLNISLHTVRTHLKAIFAKTGIRSQAELVRRIATGPACLRSR